MNSNNPKPKKRVGLILRSMQAPAWIHRAVETVQKSRDAGIALLILAEGNAADPAQTGGFLYKMFSRFEDRNFPAKPDYRNPRDLAPLVAGTPTITIQPSLTKGVVCLRHEDCEKIKTYDLDVLFLVEPMNLKGQILNIPRHGVWQYGRPLDHVPAGFWEVLNKKPTTQLELLQLSENPERVQVLYSSFSSTLPTSTNRNSSQAYWKGAAFLDRALRALDSQKPTAQNAEPGQNAVAPLNHRLVVPLTRHVAQRVTRKVDRLRSIEQWMLLYTFASGKEIDLKSFIPLLPPKDRFWADPFVLHRDGTYFIFIEEAPFKNKKGHISVITMDEKGAYQMPVKIIEKPYHMSYPFLLEWDGELFMIPESSQNKTIDLYRCTGFPFEWTLEKTLMDGIVAVDATLHRQSDRWWMFANIIENEGASSWDELFLFWSDSPVGPSWTPHPRNPVISDVRTSRPAGGLYKEGERLIRPSQNCAGRYGYGLNLNRVVELSPEVYKEEPMRFFGPSWDPRMKAVHTINRAENLTVIDGIMKRPRRG